MATAKMVRVDVAVDEQYPVYFVHRAAPGDEGRDTMDVPEVFMERFEAARKEWMAVQKEMKQMHDADTAAARARRRAAYHAEGLAQAKVNKLKVNT